VTWARHDCRSARARATNRRSVGALPARAVGQSAYELVESTQGKIAAQRLGTASLGHTEMRACKPFKAVARGSLHQDETDWDFNLVTRNGFPKKQSTDPTKNPARQPETTVNSRNHSETTNRRSETAFDRNRRSTADTKSDS
jgi:hypothetical protein